MTAANARQYASAREFQERELQETLRKLLSLGRLVITPEWNYLADDWVTCVSAADIDDDGDTEIVAGSRDGYLRVLTRQGTERWKTFIGSWITSVAIVPSPALQELGEEQSSLALTASALLPGTNKPLPRILVSTRKGQVCALDRYGNLLHTGEWSRWTRGGPTIHQLAMHPRHPREVVVGGEDHFVYVLDAPTGRELGRYDLRWRVYGVCMADVDGDGEEEILAVCTDKHIHILGRRLTSPDTVELIERGKIRLLYRSYALAVAEQESAHAQQRSPEKRRPAVIFSSDGGKDLRSWTVASQNHALPLTFNRTKLARSLRQHALRRRVLTIHTADINNDGQLEILVGSADHFLYIFDQHEQLLWKQDFGSSIYSICACDYDEDGITEIIVGMGDNNIRACKIELDLERYEPGLISNTPSNTRPALYSQIQQTFQKLRRLGFKELPLAPGDMLAELAHNLGLLQNEEEKPEKKEIALAKLKLEQNRYEEALSLLSRLREQRIQRYWEEPLTRLGHIRDLSFGNVKGNAISEILVGTDEGELIAVDINNEKKELWQPRPRSASGVVSLSTGHAPQERDYETILAVLENQTLSYISNSGATLALPPGLLEPGERVSSLSTRAFSPDGAQWIDYIVLGLEGRQIRLYNATTAQCQALIATDETATLLFAGDILGQRQLEILAANAGHAVVLYAQDQADPARYLECWRYQTGDRIRGLCAVDIDNDGQVEIVIGSEDRNVYVLNHLGELKWRYFMPDGVFSIDVCNIDHDSQDEHEILAGVDDGSVYILNCRGDLKLQIQIGDRVRVVRARDLHPQKLQRPQDRYLRDDMVEIAVATDDSLMLFQYLPPDDVKELIDQSWYFVLNNVEVRDALYTYSDYRTQPDEYVRAFALSRLAGQKQHQDEDFTHISTAIAKDPSLVVSEALARAIVNLCRTSSKQDMHQSRRLLLQLAKKPHRRTRIALINMLDELAKVDKRLSFDYLKRFLRNEDLWLRRMVIRQLYNMVELDPEQVFALLKSSAHDKHLWIRQEIGRSLARYFDYRRRHSPDQWPRAETGSPLRLCPPRSLLLDLHELLSSGIDVAITQQVATSSQEPAIKQLFATYARFQQAISLRLGQNPLDNSLEGLQRVTRLQTFLEHKKAYQNDLTAFLVALQSTMQLMPQVEDILVVYQELLNVLQVHTLSDIEQFQRLTDSEEMRIFTHFKAIDATLSRILAVVDLVKRYRKREALRDQAATLLEAINLLIQIRHHYLESRLNASETSLLPEDALFRIALQQWYALLQQELRKLSGAAQISIELLPHAVQHADTVELTFQLTNSGKSAADAVRVSIPASSPDYEVVGNAACTLPEVSTSRAQTTSFLLKPLTESFRLVTTVIYNDAEKHDCVQQQGHNIDLQPVRSEFKEILNPYHGGTPASDAKMFYGRAEDLLTLSKALGGTTASANRVILLIGQRRSGKTSLIYQLEHRLHPHVPVHIDLQLFALANNEAELFSDIALKIQEAMQAKGLLPPSLTESEMNFRADPGRTFDLYLKACTQLLNGQRLILFFDEFEIFSQLIQQKRLDENVMHYLRSIMQHRLGVNFLLAGAPHLLLHDLNNRSALLNIAQHHHLSRLTAREATDLITQPVPDLTYDPLALELIRQLTGDQPYLIHLLCEELIYYCNKERKNYANTNDVRKIIDNVLERGDNYFWMIWRLASFPEERLILALLAGEPARGQDKVFSLADLKKAFSDLNCSYNSEKTRQALHHLQQEELIEIDNHGQLFSIPIDLTRLWLYRHTTPERIARDEFNGGE